MNSFLLKTLNTFFSDYPQIQSFHLRPMKWKIKNACIIKFSRFKNKTKKYLCLGKKTPNCKIKSH